MARRAALSALLLFAGSAFAQETKKEAPPRATHTIVRAVSPVTVDGSLDEPAWQSASVIPIRYEWLPGDNIAPPVRTDVLVAFDSRNFYIAFRAFDPNPAQIRAHLTDRDVAFQDDTVGFMIDPFNDRRRAFQFRINAAGAQMDATNSDVDGSEDWSWDAIWASAARITAEGYTVEVAIPFRSLRFPNTGSVQTWGFVAMRDYPRKDRYRLQTAWRDRNRDCIVCQFDDLTGFENIRPGRDIELDPTVTASRVDVRDPFPGGSLEGGDMEFEPGLTAKWGITPNITLNGTINPDFSHVEADAAQLAVNERFALFFPEKRPFFLEGADFFSTTIPAVFTRTIADPAWGIKVTGKQGRNAGGAFIAHDEVNNLIFPSREFSGSTSIDQRVLSGVFRYRADVGKNSNVGLLYTGREADGYHNHVGGIDGTLRLTRSDTVRFQYLMSSTRYPDAVARTHAQPSGSFSDPGYALTYSHVTRDWFWRANYSALAPGFRTDSGFIVRNDYRQISGGVERHIWGKKDSWYNRLIVGAGHDQTVDYDGEGRHEDGWDFFFAYLGPLQSEVAVAVAPNTEHFLGKTYDNLRYSFDFSIRPSGHFALQLDARFGEVIDFANRRQADQFVLAPRVEFSVGRRLTGSVSHTFQRLDVDRGRLFEANLTQARLVYHFNIRTFVRAIVQYTDVQRNVAAYLVPVQPETRRLLNQLLFSYKLNPQTVLLAGYSDNALGLEQVALTKTDRAYFVKLGYAWLF